MGTAPGVEIKHLPTRPNRRFNNRNLINYKSYKMKKTGIELIADERKEQILKHGFDTNHDAMYNDPNAHHQTGELTYAALHALWPEGQFYPRTFEKWFADKITTKTYKERLIIAGALLAAEIDRIQNLEP